MKKFGLIFWTVLFGLIFYLTIDYKDVKKRIVFPVYYKITDTVNGSTPEEEINNILSSSKNKIGEIKSIKQYYCDPEFSLEDLCVGILSRRFVRKAEEMCDSNSLNSGDKVMNIIVKDSLNIYGKGKDKSEATCNLLKKDFEDEIELIELHIDELDNVLNEGEARSYINTLKLNKKENQKQEEELLEKERKELFKLSYEKSVKQVANEREKEKQKKIAIIKDWYSSKKSDENFKEQISKAIKNKQSDEDLTYDDKIMGRLCFQMTEESEKIKEVDEGRIDNFTKYCERDVYIDFVKIILERN